MAERVGTGDTNKDAVICSATGKPATDARCYGQLYVKRQIGRTVACVGSCMAEIDDKGTKALHRPPVKLVDE